MVDSQLLPAQFGELERFVGTWALSDDMQRWYTRLGSSMGDIRDLYDRMLPRMEEILEFLKEKTVSELTDTERNLYYLAMAFMDIGPAVEIYKSPVHTRTVFDHRRLDIKVKI